MIPEIGHFLLILALCISLVLGLRYLRTLP